MKKLKIRCRNCGNYFYPDKYNSHHQKYCSRIECRKASNRASSKTYRKKKSKEAAFRESESSRARDWYSKHSLKVKNRKKSCKKVSEKKVIRDFAQVEKLKDEMVSLRDFANLQSFILQGVIYQLTGFGLRDDISNYIRRMYDKGREVSAASPETNLLIQNLHYERQQNEVQKNDCTGKKT